MNPWTVIVFAMMVMLAACTRTPDAPSPEVKQQAAAEKDLNAYRQLVQAQSVELAASIGRDLVTRYPGTPAAAEVQQTLADMESKAHAIVDAKRLSALWLYQAGEAQGGAQNVASIYSTEPARAPERMRLLLRRHAAWGRSVYLHGDQAGFECAKPCRIQVRFDDLPPESWEGEIPSGGEPAIFVVDDGKFIDRLAASRRISFEVRRERAGPQTALFEVDGFEPAKWPELSGK